MRGASAGSSSTAAASSTSEVRDINLAIQAPTATSVRDFLFPQSQDTNSKNPRDLLASNIKEQRAQADNTLRALLAQNQPVRDWVRTHARRNGSMHPHEHQELIPSGIGLITVFAKRNNTFCTLADWEHRVLRTVSAGGCDLRGWNRGTAEAGTRAATRIAQLAVERGFRQVYVTLKGFGPGRETAFRSLVATAGLQIVSIRDRTPVQHGGCRPKKARRI